MIQHLSEVCSLSCRAKSWTVSELLQIGFRFFRPPLPTHPSASLRIAFHIVMEWLGLPCSTDSTQWVSVCRFAGGTNRSREATYEHFNLTLYHFGSGLSASFGLFTITTFISSSHMLHAIILSSPPAWCCQNWDFLTIISLSGNWGLHCSRASHKTVTSNACRGKKPLVIQQADSEISYKISDIMSQRMPGGVGGLLSDGESYPDSRRQRRLDKVLDEVSTAIHSSGAAVNK